MIECLSIKSEEYEMTYSENDKWEEKGIRFEILTKDRIEECRSFINENLIPDEPLSASLINGRNGRSDKEMRKMIFEEVITYCIDKPYNLVALDKEDKIIGLRTGAIETPESASLAKQYNWIMWFKKLSFMVPHIFYKLALIFEFSKKGMEYGKQFMFTNQFPEASKIYEGHCVCVSKEARGMKLGKELVVRTMKIAKEQDCDYTYILATGKYSQNIFKELGFTVLKERKYDEFKYKNGDPLFVDIHPHTVCQVVYLKMK